MFLGPVHGAFARSDAGGLSFWKWFQFSLQALLPRRPSNSPKGSKGKLCKMTGVVKVGFQLPIAYLRGLPILHPNIMFSTLVKNKMTVTIRKTILIRPQQRMPHGPRRPVLTRGLGASMRHSPSVSLKNGLTPFPPLGLWAT